MRLLPLHLLASLTAVLAGKLSAQDSLAGLPEVHLQAVENASGRPLLRTWLHHWGRGQAGNLRYLGYSRGDTSVGVLSLTPTTRSRVEVLCERENGVYGGHRLALLDSVELAKILPSDTLVLRVDASDCDQRPLAKEYGVWQGYYTAGFETSAFQWCGDSTRSIWVRYAERGPAQATVSWPAPKFHAVPEYFVRFRGTLVGPFAYGHFGMSDYELAVDSVLDVRLPSGNDCGT